MLDTPVRSASAKAGPATVGIFFFGRVADACGRTASLPVPAGGCGLHEVKKRLGATIEGAAEALAQPGVRAAVAQHMALDEDVWVNPGDEVAFFSAFSGG